MTEWRQVSLGDVATLSNGANFTKDSFGSGLRIIGVRDFGDRLYPDWSETDEVKRSAVSSDRALLAEGDLLFVRSNGNRSLVGRCLLVTPGPEATHSAFTIRARPDRSQVMPRFLAYQMRHAHREGQMLAASGTNITNLNQSILAGVPVLLPELPDQARIVSVLAALDDLIENNRRRAEVLEEMARAIYREWFVHFRYPGHENVPLVDSPLGPIPDGWEVKPLGDLSSNFDRRRKPLSKAQRSERAGAFPYYGAAKLIDWVDGWIFDGEYLLFAEDGSVQTPDGFPVLQLVDGRFWANNHTHILQGERVSTRFLYLATAVHPISGYITALSVRLGVAARESGFRVAGRGMRVRDVCYYRGGCGVVVGA